MGLRERVTLLLLTVIFIQICNHNCLTKNLNGPALKKFLKDIRKSNADENAKLQILKQKQILKNRQNARVRADNPEYKSISTVYNFPETEYPTLSTSRIPFHLQKTRTFKNDNSQKEIQFLSSSKILNNLKKQAKLKLKSNALTTNVPKANNFPDFTPAPDPFSFRNAAAFPDVEYPLSAKDIWTQNYWSRLSEQPVYKPISDSDIWAKNSKTCDCIDLGDTYDTRTGKRIDRNSQKNGKVNEQVSVTNKNAEWENAELEAILFSLENKMKSIVPQTNIEDNTTPHNITINIYKQINDTNNPQQENITSIQSSNCKTKKGQSLLSGTLCSYDAQELINANSSEVNTQNNSKSYNCNNESSCSYESTDSISLIETSKFEDFSSKSIDEPGTLPFIRVHDSTSEDNRKLQEGYIHTNSIIDMPIFYSNLSVCDNNTNFNCNSSYSSVFIAKDPPCINKSEEIHYLQDSTQINKNESESVIPNTQLNGSSLMIPTPSVLTGNTEKVQNSFILHDTTHSCNIQTPLEECILHYNPNCILSSSQKDDFHDSKLDFNKDTETNITLEALQGSHSDCCTNKTHPELSGIAPLIEAFCNISGNKTINTMYGTKSINEYMPLSLESISAQIQNISQSKFLNKITYDNSFETRSDIDLNSLDMAKFEDSENIISSKINFSRPFINSDHSDPRPVNYNEGVHIQKPDYGFFNTSEKAAAAPQNNITTLLFNTIFLINDRKILDQFLHTNPTNSTVIEISAYKNDTVESINNEMYPNNVSVIFSNHSLIKNNFDDTLDTHISSNHILPLQSHTCIELDKVGEIKTTNDVITCETDANFTCINDFKDDTIQMKNKNSDFFNNSLSLNMSDTKTETNSSIYMITPSSLLLGNERSRDYDELGIYFGNKSYTPLGKVQSKQDNPQDTFYNKTKVPGSSMFFPSKPLAVVDFLSIFNTLNSTNDQFSPKETEAQKLNICNSEMVEKIIKHDEDDNAKIKPPTDLSTQNKNASEHLSNKFQVDNVTIPNVGILKEEVNTPLLDKTNNTKFLKENINLHHHDESSNSTDTIIQTVIG